MSRRTHRPALLAALALTVSLVAHGEHSLAQAAATRAHVAALASEAGEGRLTGSEGERRSGDYIISQLRRIGALPLLGATDYRSSFQFTSGARDGGSTIAVSSSRPGIAAQSFGSRAEVQALSFSDDGSVSGPVVFAGYGIVVPGSQDYAYDSYASLDVKDKIVLVLRYFPESAEPKAKSLLARYAALRYKALVARQRGAKALLVVAGPHSPNAGETIPMSFDTAIAGSGIVAASISASVAGALFAGTDRSLEAAQRALDTGDPHAAGFDLPGVSAIVKTAVVREKREAANVLAYLPASAPGPASEKPWIALGAHYDHLGRGEAGNSLAGKGEAGRIHYGADDNASGTAAVLSAGEALAAQPRKRNVLLAFWSGEEFGLLGSAAFVAAPPVALDQMVAYLNFDMVGRMQDNKLIVQATGTSPAWPRMLEQANVPAGFDLALQEDPYQPTDVASFNQAGVPSLNFYTGAHADYHRPSDTADKINYEDLDRVAGFAAGIARRIADLDRAPAFVKVEEKTLNRPSRAGMRIYTGTIPDYAAQVKGLLLSGVIGGGPADKAGLQKGDLIVEIAGQTITNIYDYTYALEVLRVDVPAKVVYVRAGERKETLLTPAVRK
ncbi:MAG: M20/M25/M40 family metallo-hydrolase [Betaproteobacteria bacterium]|nr:M20/M25/M40 family metallo-hydrolase [Betaproteobacteria bacterium]